MKIDVTVTKLGKIVGTVVVGLVALGVIANFHDIKRYARMTMM